ncbi:unnamed protein product [Sphacelaria rigidula]
METTIFFELEDFLPQYVSSIPSYAHASIALVLAGLMTYYLGAEYFVADFNRDEQVFETEVRARKYVLVAASILVSLFVADAVFTLSFRLRGFKANKNHFVWRRWFPKLYAT